MPTGPFHTGELALQEATGMRARMEAVGPKVIRDHMPDQHRELFEKLPTLFVGALDAAGQPWATLVHGPPGFARAPDERTLRLAAHPRADDPARVGLRVGAPVGLLGIEPHTRRRNRANGVIVAIEPEAWSVRIHQSFGNCPKYIHARTPEARPERVAEPPRAEGPGLSPWARELVEKSDTLFVASSSAGRLEPDEVTATAGAGVDVSHRGGRAGFVVVDPGPDADELTIPDYLGNSMYSTLGNLLVWPRAGLLFLDWEHGHLLQLATTAEVVTEGQDLARFPGALRLLRLRIQGGWLRPFAMPLAWTPPEAPPQFRARAGGREGERG